MKNKSFHNRFILFVVFLGIISSMNYCTAPQDKSISVNKPEKSDSAKSKLLEIELFNDTLEVFIDSTTFGRKGKTKLEFRVIHSDNESYANIKLFIRNKQNWILTNELDVLDISVIGGSRKLNDYNSDSFNDLLFHSAEAARGANNIQTLVLFDPNNNKLIHVKNSESYPNIQYNAKLHCIDAWSVYGGQMTHFLRLKGDSLVEFASVENYDGRIIVSLTNSKGEKREIKNSDAKTLGCDFCRFKNYQPLELE